MQNLYRETNVLDKRVIDKFYLTEEILLENASLALANLVKRLTHPRSLVYVICGGGNNGADGLAMARKIAGDFVVKVYMASEPKTPLCEKELFRCKGVGVEFVKKLYPCDVVVDCLFGSGFRGEFDLEHRALIEAMNQMARIKIACDVPSGVGRLFKGIAFKADYTLCMGALKLDLFGEWSKDFVGEVSVADLGVSRKVYEVSSNLKLLEEKDLVLPVRHKQDTHKGEYGHLAVFAPQGEGSKEGASALCALGAIAFGVGLVSLVGKVAQCPYEVMQAEKIPPQASAFAFGIGAEKVSLEELNRTKDKPCVYDAGVFGFEGFGNFLHSHSLHHIVLTPHIKEFASLLRICGIADLDTSEVKTKRNELLQEFCQKYPDVVVVLKGANTLIAQNEKLFVCTLGSENLAKGGSGDVLSGMIASLLAQGRDSLQAGIQGVLAHSLASRKIKTSYGLNPMDLIENVKYL